MNISAIHLVRNDDHVFVKIEVGGRWVTVIKEFVDSPFSHIVEEGGMQRNVDAFSEIEALVRTPE